MRGLAGLRVVAVASFDHGPGIWRGFEPHREGIGAAGLKIVKTDAEAVARGGGRCGQPPRLETGDDGFFRGLILDDQAHQVIPRLLFSVCRSGGRRSGVGRSGSSLSLPLSIGRQYLLGIEFADYVHALVAQMRRADKITPASRPRRATTPHAIVI